MSDITLKDYAVTFTVNARKITYLVADLDAVCALCQAMDCLEALMPNCHDADMLNIQVAAFTGQDMPTGDFYADRRADLKPTRFSLDDELQEAA